MKKVKLYLAVSWLSIIVVIGTYTLGNLLGSDTEAVSGTPLQNPVDVRDISLAGADGKPVTLKSLEGELALVFFGFTNCPDVCPLTLSRLSETYRTLGEPADLQIVFITVDPEDEPEQTQQYAAAFHPSFVGLSGTSSELAAATKRFFVAANSVGDRQFAHTDAVYVLSKQGQLIRLYRSVDLSNLEEDLPKLLKKG